MSSRQATCDVATKTRANPSHHTAVLFCAVLAQLMIVMDMTIVSVALPSMQGSLGFSDIDRQWVVTAYTLAFGALVLFGGKLSQVLGLRRSYLIAITGFSLASLMGGLSQSVGMLLVARAVQGAFAGLLAPTNLSLISTTFTEPKARAKVFAAFGATGGAGAAVGMVLGGVLTQYLDWRWCLFVNVVIAITAAGVFTRASRNMWSGASGQRLFGDVLGLLLGCATVFSFVYGFSEASRTSWNAAGTISWLIGGGICGVLFVMRERTARNPLLPLWIVWDPGRAASYLVLALGGWFQMGGLLYLTYFFQDHLGYSAAKTGVAFLPLIASLVVGAIVTNRMLVPRLGIRLVFPLAWAVVAFGFLLLSQITPDSSYGGSLLAGLIVGGLGLGLGFAPAFSAGSKGVPAEQNGLANATLSTFQQIGASFGVAFLSTFATQHATGLLTGQADAITQEMTQTLAAAQVLPTSAQGQQIASGILAVHTSTAEVSAYAAGFQVLAVAASVAVVILLVAGVALNRWRSR